MSTTEVAEKVQSISIAAPNFKTIQVRIIGTSPLLLNKFSKKARQEMHDKHEKGSTAGKGKNREKKDFQACYEGAKYKSKQGWCGINASAFRCAMISACRTVGFKMTLAKLSVSVVADGFDFEDQTPLVKITKGEPKYSEMPTRNANGQIDLRARPIWAVGWEAIVTIRFDGDQFTATDVANLMMRVGQQVGIGEGRNDSKQSAGMGFGEFKLADQ